MISPSLGVRVLDFDHHSADNLDISLGVDHSASANDHEDIMMKDIGLGENHSAGDHDHEDLAKIT